MFLELEQEYVLPDALREKMRDAASYREAAVWLEQIHAGMTGGELYDLMEQLLPSREYHWKLNPRHLAGEEEWMCSPVFNGSEELLGSGMILQTDVIPSMPGYPGISMPG